MTSEELRTMIQQKIERGLDARLLGRDVIRGEDRELLLVARQWLRTMPDAELIRFLAIKEKGNHE